MRPSVVISHFCAIIPPAGGHSVNERLLIPRPLDAYRSLASRELVFLIPALLALIFAKFLFLPFRRRRFFDHLTSFFF